MIYVLINFSNNDFNFVLLMIDCKNYYCKFSFRFDRHPLTFFQSKLNNKKQKKK